MEGDRMIVFIIILVLLFILFCKIEEKNIAKALESDRIFPSFDDSIHQMQEQQDRIQRAVEQNISVKSILSNGYSGKIIGTTGNVYLTTLKNCTCKDFKQRQKPCKHMYFLAAHTFRCNISENGGTYELERLFENQPITVNNDTVQPDPKSEFHDNMNYMIFEGDGIFLETGRKRKIRVEAFSEEEARSDLASAGYDPASLNISRGQFEPPTPDQLDAMRKHRNRIPKNACKYDISYLISKKMENQKDADRQLMDFATKHKVKFSYFTGENSLYYIIWNTFDDAQCAAFYLLCVRKDLTRKWEFALWDYYLDKAATLLNDPKFMNSFKRLLNADSTDFLKMPNKNLNCYKMAREII